MKEILLVKNGEIALKGLNRSTFEDILVKNIKWRLHALGKFKITKAQSTIYIEPMDDSIPLDEAARRLTYVFGIASICRACVCEKSFDDIKEKAGAYLKGMLASAATFKVEAKRSDKKFPMASPELCRELGGHILDCFPHLSVDVHNPDVTVRVEIRDFGAYLHADPLPGAGGLPVGSGGHGCILISGGIDSPVAGYMMAKRGIDLCAVHFVSPPYTSERAKLKVIDLLKQMTTYCGRINLHIVPFTKIQEQIKTQCAEELFTIIMRRFMMRISSQIARENGCQALITGESVGQVASQTLEAIACTERTSELPVLRPLIGMDKEEIIAISRKIDTFEISIQPYEDCCTVFTPKHPRTRPKVESVEAEESKLAVEELCREAIEGVEQMLIAVE